MLPLPPPFCTIIYRSVKDVVHTYTYSKFKKKQLLKNSTVLLSTVKVIKVKGSLRDGCNSEPKDMGQLNAREGPGTDKSHRVKTNKIRIQPGL